MTELEMKQVFRLLQTAYPNAEMFQANVRERFQLWLEFFTPVPPELMKKAVARCIANCKFAPTISELADAIKAEVPETDGSGWDDLLTVCERINDVRQDFGYTYVPEGETKTQGELARDIALRIFQSVNPVLREYVKSFSGLLRISHEIGEADRVGIGILRREFENWKKEHRAASTLAVLLEENKRNLLTTKETE